MKILWFVTHGHDEYHMNIVSHFKKLKDAISYIKSIPSTPDGRKCTVKLQKYKYIKSTIYGDNIDIKEINVT